MAPAGSSSALPHGVDQPLDVRAVEQAAAASRPLLYFVLNTRKPGVITVRELERPDSIDEIADQALEAPNHVLRRNRAVRLTSRFEEGLEPSPSGEEELSFRAEFCSEKPVNRLRSQEAVVGVLARQLLDEAQLGGT